MFITDAVDRCIRAGQLGGDPSDISHALLGLAIGLATQETQGWLGSRIDSRERRWNQAVDALLARIGSLTTVRDGTPPSISYLLDLTATVCPAGPRAGWAMSDPVCRLVTPWRSSEGCNPVLPRILRKGKRLKHQTLYRGLAVGAVVAAASTGLFTAVAAATPAPVDVTMVGANASQEVMGYIATKYNAETATKAANVTVTNVDAQPADPGTVAPSDAHCNGGKSITYVSEATTKANQETAPNGSGAGKTALSTSVTNGDSCTSIARSSSPGSSSDPAGTQAFAFAVDSVTWSTLPESSGGNAPNSMTMTKLEGIYDCHFTNWSQVGGKSAPIQRFYPVEGSGIATFFAGVLGFDPRTLGGENTCTTAPTLIEQNDNSAIPKADIDNAVTIGSGGEWSSEANGIDTPDLREGFILHGINGIGSPVVKNSSTGKFGPATFVKESNVEPATYQPTSNTAVQGINNLYNFINTNSVDYAAAAAFVGLNSPLCNNKNPAAITLYGLHPLTKCVEES